MEVKVEGEKDVNPKLPSYVEEISGRYCGYVFFASLSIFNKIFLF